MSQGPKVGPSIPKRGTELGPIILIDYAPEYQLSYYSGYVGMIFAKNDCLEPIKKRSGFWTYTMGYIRHVYFLRPPAPPFMVIFIYVQNPWKRHVSLCSSISNPYIKSI